MTHSNLRIVIRDLNVLNYFSFFRAHRTNDLTKKFEKVGPFECDELEKHCRVSAKCDPTKVPALHDGKRKVQFFVSGSAAGFPTDEKSIADDEKRK